MDCTFYFSCSSHNLFSYFVNIGLRPANKKFGSWIRQLWCVNQIYYFSGKQSSSPRILSFSKFHVKKIRQNSLKEEEIRNISRVLFNLLWSAILFCSSCGEFIVTSQEKIILHFLANLPFSAWLALDMKRSSLLAYFLRGRFSLIETQCILLHASLNFFTFLRGCLIFRQLSWFMICLEFFLGMTFPLK